MGLRNLGIGLLAAMASFCFAPQAGAAAITGLTVNILEDLNHAAPITIDTVPDPAGGYWDTGSCGSDFLTVDFASFCRRYALDFTTALPAPGQGLAVLLEPNGSEEISDLIALSWTNYVARPDNIAVGVTVCNVENPCVNVVEARFDFFSDNLFGDPLGTATNPHPLLGVVASCYGDAPAVSSAFQNENTDPDTIYNIASLCLVDGSFAARTFSGDPFDVGSLKLTLGVRSPEVSSIPAPGTLALLGLGLIPLLGAVRARRPAA